MEELSLAFPIPAVVLESMRMLGVVEETNFVGLKLICSDSYLVLFLLIKSLGLFTVAWLLMMVFM